MNQMDRTFITNCKDILYKGVSDEGTEVRPHWEDGTPAHTKMIFNKCNTYDLRDNYIPILTLRKVNFRACVDEILWIYQKCSSNINDLNSHIWDSWADEDGSIGQAYGAQIGQSYRHHIYKPGEGLRDYPSAYIIGCDMASDFHMDLAKETWVYLNQIDGVIYDLRNSPSSRSIITNMFKHQDLYAMNLRPCAYSLTFNVQHDPEGRDILHMLLNQRSQDMITANSWNVTQYAVLQHMIAQVCGMKVGTLTHMVANMHIYDRHEEIAKQMIRMWNKGCVAKPEPKFWINPDIRSFKDFTVDDVKLFDYQYADYTPKIEVAV